MVVRYLKDEIQLEKEIYLFIDSLPIEGKDVLIKPNFVSLDPYPYTTSLPVLNRVIELLKKRDIRSLKIAELPSSDYSNVFCEKAKSFAEMKFQMNEFHQLLRNTLNKSQEVEYFNSKKNQIFDFYKFFFDDKHLNNGDILETVIPLNDMDGEFHYRRILVDEHIESNIVDISSYVVINLPVLKLHTTTGFTASIKNMFSLYEDRSKLLFHKYKCVGKAVKQLYEDIKGLEIYTFLDARNIPDSQQYIWGTGEINSLDAVIYGNDILQVDKEAYSLLVTRFGEINPKDKDFIDFLCYNKI